MCEGRGVGEAHAIGDHDQFAFPQRGTHAIGIGQTHHGVGGDDPHCLDGTGLDGLKQFHGLETGLVRDRGRSPEALHAVAMLGIGNIHVRGEIIRHPAYLAPAHRIRLTRKRKRSHAGASDTARQQVAVDDGIDLVRAAR